MNETPMPQTELPASSPVTFIGKDAPRDGRQWDAQCARCGSSLYWISCEACGGEGMTGPGELYDEDPLWYDQDDYETCHQCAGKCSWPVCLSSKEYCESNPLGGRDSIERSTPEWFTFDPKRDLSPDVSTPNAGGIEPLGKSPSSPPTTKEEA